MRSCLLGAVSKLIGAIVVAAVVIPWDNSTWYVQEDPAFVIRVRMENDVPVEGFKYDHDGHLLSRWRYDAE